MKEKISNEKRNNDKIRQAMNIYRNIRTRYTGQNRRLLPHVLYSIGWLSFAIRSLYVHSVFEIILNSFGELNLIFDYFNENGFPP